MIRQLIPVVLISFFILDNSFNEVESLEPISTTLAVFAAGSSIVGLLFHCKFHECCDGEWIKPNMTGLHRSLEEKLHGQHLVTNTVIRSLKGHVTKKHPVKALVLSFHGWTGGGKNFVSKLIAEHLFQNGMNSSYVHMYVATQHFPHQKRIELYQDMLREQIRAHVKACPRALFIFDEMDKMPRGLIDTLKPYLDHYPEIDGVDFRQATFIFLSNTGGMDIHSKALQHWEAGKKREDLRYRDLEASLSLEVVNVEGGLWHSSLIDTHLIDVFVPFLPMEKKHVKMCIRDNLRLKGYPVMDEIVDEIASELQYKKVYSTSGCKKVDQKVDMVMQDS